MDKEQVIRRLEKASIDYREALEFDERSAVIQSLAEDLENGSWDIT